jgi:hypothetical protein
MKKIDSSLKAVFHRGLLGSLVLVGSIAPAAATTLDVSTPGSDGYVQEAYFKYAPLSGTGSGAIDVFHRVQDNPIEEGFNSNSQFRDTQSQAKLIQKQDLLLETLTLPGSANTQWYSFLIDTGESGNNGKITLTKLEIYTSPTDTSASVGNSNPTSGLGTLVYSLDKQPDLTTDDDSTVTLGFTSGNGSGDSFFVLPASKLASAAATDFIYFYVEFQGNSPGTGEEIGFALVPGLPLIPEPSTYAAVGFVGLIVMWSSRRKLLAMLKRGTANAGV